MQEVTTIPGKTYAVECAGEVVITNNETGAIAAQGDGSGQVLFTACSNSYSVSDDTAKVVALFKLAPRLKLTLLQGVAGGLLPKGYTELEYLESSGTQWINTLLYLHGNSLVEFAAMPLQRIYTNFFFDTRLNLVESGFFGLSYGYNGAHSNTMRIAYGNQYAYIDRYSDGSSGVLALGEKYTFLIDKGLTYKNGSPVSRYLGDAVIQEQSFTSRMPCYLFASVGNGAISRFVMRLYSFSVKENDVLLLNLIPALRKSDGVPGMWDAVSKQFLTNAGSGTFGYRIKRTGEEVAPMSLRDPWRVAPSGVYARKAGDNELEIVADTDDVTGDGWEWFANVGEAYDAYGIVMQEDFN